MSWRHCGQKRRAYKTFWDTLNNTVYLFLLHEILLLYDLVHLWSSICRDFVVSRHLFCGEANFNVCILYMFNQYVMPGHRQVKCFPHVAILLYQNIIYHLVTVIYGHDMCETGELQI